MSEREEEELSPEAKAFLSRHASTGEPWAELLERGKLRLASPVKAVPSLRRPRFPPEVMAAAAVVVLLLGAQVLYLALRPQKIAAPQVVKAAPGGEADVEAVAEAWRAGDFTKASRLASSECRSAGCGALNSELGELLGLTRRVETLSDDELERLSAFDRKLSDGLDSALKRTLEHRARRLAPVPTSPAAQSQAEALFEEARNERAAKNDERAVMRLEKCVKIAPGHYPCYRQLGSAYAALATRDQSASDMDKARRYYEQYLELAPPDDEYVPKVRAILDLAKRDDTATPQQSVATSFPLGEGDMFAEATRAKREGRWALAMQLALKVLDAEPEHRGARALLDELRGRSRDAYLRGYQLREANPEEALKLFKFVLSITPAEDDTHQRAQSRVIELEKR